MLHTPGKARKLFTPLALSALGLLVLAAAGSSGAPAATGLLPEQAVAPTTHERSLAPQHSYFLAGDVTGFDRWRLKFGDMIHTGEIDPAYLMFYVFQRRNRERMDYAL